ncbi:MAG: hypothetical protein V1904_00070, partial [Bacteroidota bacterium]
MKKEKAKPAVYPFGDKSRISRLSIVFIFLILICNLLGTQSLAQPANNLCSGAVTLTVGAAATSGTVLNATEDFYDAYCGASWEKDVWYKFTTGTAGSYTITENPVTGMDGVIELRSGACTGTYMACGDGALATDDDIITYALAASTQYYVRVYDYSGSPTAYTFTIQVTAPAGAPANDNCAGAVTLTVNAAATGGTIVAATQTIAASATCPGDGSVQDVWYKFTTLAAGVHTITLVSVFDGVVEYRSGACNGTFVACADIAGAGGTDVITTASLPTATTYYVRIYEYSGSGTFTIQVTGPAGGTPAITLANNGTQVTAANVNQGTTNHVLHKFSLAVTTANATLTGLQCVTAGTYLSADITNLKVRYSADATLDGADATLSTYTTPGIAGTKTFPSFTSQVINSGATGYIFITADIAAGATAGNTINVNAVTTAHLTFSSGTKSGSTTAG